MRVALLIAILLGFATLPGCGGNADNQRPKGSAGVVDESLPPEQRERQDAFIRALAVIQGGTDVAHLDSYEADLDFQESAEDFYGEGVALARWDWAGPPVDDKLPVRLEMTLDEPPGDKTVSYERTYQVRKNGNRFTITRADQ